jgi:hypothetical protein
LTVGYLVTRAVSVLRLSRREAWWKDAEILMLRHQLAGQPLSRRQGPGGIRLEDHRERLQRMEGRSASSRTGCPQTTR